MAWAGRFAECIVVVTVVAAVSCPVLGLLAAQVSYNRNRIKIVAVVSLICGSKAIHR